MTTFFFDKVKFKIGSHHNNDFQFLDSTKMGMKETTINVYVYVYVCVFGLRHSCYCC